LKGIWIISVLVSILVLGGFAYVHYAEADFRVFTQANIEHERDPNLLYIMLRNNGPSFYFVPTDIRIVVGDTITFSNHDVVAHELEIHVHDGTIVRSEGSSTSLFNDDNHDNYFTSQFEVNTAEGKDVTRYQLDAMQSFSYTFSSVGTYEIIDPNHQDVVGRIVVLDEENEDTNRDYVFSQSFNKMMDQMMGHTTSHEEDDHVDKAERKFLKKDTCKEALKQQEKLAKKGKQSDLIDDFIIKEKCSTDEERDDKDDEERDDKDDEERDDKDDEEPPVPPVPPGPPLPDPADVCSAAARTISYTVLAINVDITINRFGDHDPSGMMYVLEENLDAVRAQETSPLPRVSTGLGDDPIQPLVIRANLGDCVKVIF